jgi:hypothetical protein
MAVLAVPPFSNAKQITARPVSLRATTNLSGMHC